DGRKVSLIQCLCPVMTAEFSFMILGEKLSPAGMIGALIIIACVAAGSVMEE
ncbi:MAG: EamA family transporter, partial [Firmicutes bacterium]|nr:EamA family transporter [Bacillota bacterium]